MKAKATIWTQRARNENREKFFCIASPSVSSLEGKVA